MRPILLLDDVSSELDRDRTAALFSFLREQRGQVFLTTTRPELIDTGDDGSARRDFVVRNGVVVRTISGREPARAPRPLGRGDTEAAVRRSGRAK